MEEYGQYAKMRVGRLPSGVKDLDEFLSGGGEAEMVEWEEVSGGV
jgi:hypothetical protein